MTIEQIQAAIQRTRGRLSDKPIRERLKVFRKAKLVEQPRGPRGGHSITDAGKALVNRATG
jgi:repressor of nif and glnA expression